jgi:glycogen debranching enzyme
VRGVFVDAFHILCDGPVTVGELPPELQTASSGSLTLIGTRSRFNPRLLESNFDRWMDDRQRWLKQQKAPQGGSSERRRTLGKALSVMKGQVSSAQGLLHHRWTTPDRWPHRDCWLWDSAFHAIGWRHVDPLLARETLEAVFDAQQPDGRIPHQANPTTVSAIIQPPVLALACKLVAGPTPDLVWIESVYPHLCRYIEWDLDHRIAPGAGLAQWHMDENPISRCAESGMDNSPRFDAPGAPYAVDLNAFLSMECKILAGFALSLGNSADASKWSSRNLQLNALINERLWDDEAGFYFDQQPDRKHYSGVIAVSGFLPLLCGAPNGLQARRLAAHLENPRTFATAAPLPSAVVTPGTTHPQDMWRGPMWMNMNWLVATGFEQAGNRNVARKLREQTMRQVEQWYLKRGSIFEFYDEHGVTPPDRLPRKGPMQWGSPYHQAVHDYGWTATLYTDLVFTAPPKPRAP